MVNLLASYYTISNYSLPDKENFDVKNDVQPHSPYQLDIKKSLINESQEKKMQRSFQKWTPNILKKGNNSQVKKHVTVSSWNTQVFIHKHSSWAQKIIKSNMSKSSGKSVMIILAGVVFLTGLECVCRIIQMAIQESA